MDFIELSENLRISGFGSSGRGNQAQPGEIRCQTRL